MKTREQVFSEIKAIIDQFDQDATEFTALPAYSILYSLVGAMVIGQDVPLSMVVSEFSKGMIYKLVEAQKQEAIEGVQ